MAGMDQTTLQQILELLKDQKKGPSEGIGRGVRPRGPPQCFYCNRPGHFIKDCRLRKAEQQNSGGPLSGPRRPQQQPSSEQALFQDFKKFMDEERAKNVINEAGKD